MIVPALFALFGLGSIGYGIYEDSTKKPAQPAKGVPPELMAGVMVLLQTGRDPIAMETMATTLDGYGYKNLAEQLRDRATELRKAQAAGVAPPPPPTQITAPMPKLTPATPTSAAELTATLTGTGVNLRSSPATTAGVLGQLNKPEIVTVLNWNAGTSGGYTWAQVRKANGVTGFAARNYLSLNGPAPAGISGDELRIAIGAEDRKKPRPAKCVAPSGCRLRTAPDAKSSFKGLIANGEYVHILKHIRGEKAERMSPGEGGWALVRGARMAGWVPSEWLLS
jgi:hypothetical protein